MNRKVISSILIVGLSVALTAPPLLAEVDNDAKPSQENTERSWRDALKTQVALARAKVALLQARSDFWLDKNKDAALKSLGKARDSLDNGRASADRITRTRIDELKLQVEQAKKLLETKGESAEEELHAIVDRSESALAAALAQAQTKSADLKNEAATRYALVEAKGAALNARIALEIEQSPQKAKHALTNAEDALQRAKVSANEMSREKISTLQKQAQAARLAVSNNTGEAKSRISALVLATEERIQASTKYVHDSEEAKLLKYRYGQLEAQAALLKANLAAKADASGKRAVAYLDESKAWYANVKAHASTRGKTEISKMSTRIDEAKLAVERKDKQARAKLAGLLEQAAEIIRDEN